MGHSVYFLLNGRRSYVGYTVNMVRRLRQHRGIIKGGARRTAMWVDKRSTCIAAMVRNFPSAHLALSFEFHSKRMRAKPKVPAPPACHPRLGRWLRALANPKFAPFLDRLQLVLVKGRTSPDLDRFIEYVHLQYGIRHFYVATDDLEFK